MTSRRALLVSANLVIALGLTLAIFVDVGQPPRTSTQYDIATASVSLTVHSKPKLQPDAKLFAALLSTPPTDQPSALDELPFRLVGIISEGDSRLAVIETNDKQTKRLRLGDQFGQ